MIIEHLFTTHPHSQAGLCLKGKTSACHSIIIIGTPIQLQQLHNQQNQYNPLIAGVMHR